jgi:molecular chaperone DnaK
MARANIDYGIDLGTTNSAISRVDGDEVKVIKSVDTQKDTTPSSVAFNKKGSILAGDAAYIVYRKESLLALSKAKPMNAFIEFKRTMGTDNVFYSPNVSKEFSSEELSAEVLKRLKEYVTDENISAAVITVPAAFKSNQIDATRRAAKLAGFDYTEVLQEPVAAAMAYGIANKAKDGFLLVFDFGGGTFDAALMKIDEGIIKVVDTEGDNYLGGKNLDYAIVDHLIIPHIKERFEIEDILSDDTQKQAFRASLKFIAEEFKNNLSFNSVHNIYVDPGDVGEDDNGEEIDIDLTISQEQLKPVLATPFQQAIDCSLDLLRRNNLTGGQVSNLILVGGPTMSPILREMLSTQICAPDTSVDPMTVVAKGAALYASTVSLSEEIIERTRDTTKIQLDINYESSTVELDEFVTFKILVDKTEGHIPDSVFSEIKRGDNAWSSGKVEINSIGEVVEVELVENKTNIFNVKLFDDKGNSLECEPSVFNVIQGSKIGSATTPYNYGIEIKQKLSGKIVFTCIKGLEKNQSLPAKGIKNGLKTQKAIRPGMASDFIKIPFYQGAYDAEGTRAINNDHIYDIIISGNDIPSLLPENSDVDLIISVDQSQLMTVQAFFPYLDFTKQIDVPSDTLQSIDPNWLGNEIKKAKGSIYEVMNDDENADKPELAQVESTLHDIEQSFENNKKDVDSHHEVLSKLRKTLKIIDEFSNKAEWPNLERELKDEFYRLEEANSELGDSKSTQKIAQLRLQLEQVLSDEDIKLGNALLDEINQLFIQLTMIYQLINFVRHYNDEFDLFHWTNKERARVILNQALECVNNNPRVDELHPLVVSLLDLLPRDEKPSGDDSILVG